MRLSGTHGLKMKTKQLYKSPLKCTASKMSESLALLLFIQNFNLKASTECYLMSPFEKMRTETNIITVRAHCKPLLHATKSCIMLIQQST